MLSCRTNRGINTRLLWQICSPLQPTKSTRKSIWHWSDKSHSSICARPGGQQIIWTLAWQILVQPDNKSFKHWHDKSWHTHTANKSIWTLRGQTAWVAWPTNNRPQHNTIVHHNTTQHITTQLHITTQHNTCSYNYEKATQNPDSVGGSVVRGWVTRYSAKAFEPV